MAEGKVPHHGKQHNQKMKPFIVLKYLQRNTDENHTCSATDIISYLQEDCGISSDRRSIYRDIDEINRVLYMLENGMQIDEAGDELEEYEDEKFIVYNPKSKGFYFRRREFEVNEVRLLVATIQSSKFLTEKQSKALIDVACTLVSDPQAEVIRDNAIYLADRNKTSNKSIMANIDTISDAMSKHLDGKYHTPEKISFDYMRYSISDKQQHVVSRSGGKYKVSPYALLINDGNYYLLAYDDKSKKIKTYRVDRMNNVELTCEDRTGAKEFEKLSLSEYSQQYFGMMSGHKERVQLRFINPLLDTAIERFGKSKDTFYGPDDDKHFTVSANVEVSEQFFAWLCGFGKRVKLIGPDTVVDEFKAYLDKLRSMY